LIACRRLLDAVVCLSVVIVSLFFSSCWLTLSVSSPLVAGFIVCLLVASVCHFVSHCRQALVCHWFGLPVCLLVVWFARCCSLLAGWFLCRLLVLVIGCRQAGLLVNARLLRQFGWPPTPGRRPSLAVVGHACRLSRRLLLLRQFGWLAHHRQLGLSVSFAIAAVSLLVAVIAVILVRFAAGVIVITPADALLSITVVTVCVILPVVRSVACCSLLGLAGCFSVAVCLLAVCSSSCSVAGCCSSLSVSLSLARCLGCQVATLVITLRLFVIEPLLLSSNPRSENRSSVPNARLINA
jgi:hypothetical protein